MTKPVFHSLLSSLSMRSLASSGDVKEESIISSKSQGCLDIRSGASRHELHKQASEFLAENKSAPRPEGKRRRYRPRAAQRRAQQMKRQVDPI